MIHRHPQTNSMDLALINHATGGPAIYKPEIVAHATKEAQARVKGFANVKEWEDARDIERAEFWNRFLKENK